MVERNNITKYTRFRFTFKLISFSLLSNEEALNKEDKKIHCCKETEGTRDKNVSVVE